MRSDTSRGVNGKKKSQTEAETAFDPNNNEYMQEKMVSERKSIQFIGKFKTNARRHVNQD